MPNIYDLELHLRLTSQQIGLLHKVLSNINLDFKPLLDGNEVTARDAREAFSALVTYLREWQIKLEQR